MFELINTLTKAALIGYLTLDTLSKYAQIFSKIQTFTSIFHTIFTIFIKKKIYFKQSSNAIASKKKPLVVIIGASLR